MEALALPVTGSSGMPSAGQKQRTTSCASSAVLAPPDFALALAGFLALTVWKAPPWTVVVALAAAGALAGAVQGA